MAKPLVLRPEFDGGKLRKPFIGDVKRLIANIRSVKHHQCAILRADPFGWARDSNEGWKFWE